MRYGKTLASLLVSAVLLTSAFTGCSASSYDYNTGQMTAAASSSSAMANFSPQMGGGLSREQAAVDAATNEITKTDGTPAPAMAADRKIIKNADISLEATDFDAALEDIARKITESGGYIESQNVDGRSMYNEENYYARHAWLSARVPADKLSSLTGLLGEQYNVTSRSESADDVSDTYFDSQARLNTLKLQEERLLEILSKAEKLEEVITLESALSNVRYEIESLTASLKRMDSQVSYSYLNVNLSEVSEYTVSGKAPSSFGERLSAAFSKSVEKLTSSLQGLLLFIVENGLVLLFYAVIVVAVAFVIRFVIMKNSRSPKRMPPAGYQAPSYYNPPQDVQPSQEPKDPEHPEQ